MIDIRKFPSAIKLINEALTNGVIVEVKREKKGISVVEISRKVKSIEPLDIDALK